MKKILKLVTIVALFLTVAVMTANASERVTMYSLDGRAINVDAREVPSYRSVGWYTNINDVRTTMYSLDGRTIEIWKSEVDNYKNVGWYENISNVKATMYSPAGIIIDVWKSEVDDYKSVGWYDDINDARVTMCARDGRTLEVWKNEYETYKAMGWYPLVELYSMDDRMIRVPEYEVEEYKQVGWYTYEGYCFNILEREYNAYITSGDNVSALQMVSSLKDIFWETEYEADVMKMMHTVMDTLRNQQQQPLIVGGYYVDNGDLSIEFNNVSYKDIIAFECLFEITDVFGNVLDSKGNTVYNVQDAYIVPGDNEIYVWNGNGSRAKWVNDIEVITVVYSDGTIWRK